MLDTHRTGSVVRVDAVRSPTGEALVLKRHHYPSVRDVRRGLFRTTFGARSRVRREAANLGRLAELGLNPALVVATGERRRAGFLIDSFLATRHLPSTDLQRWLPEAGSSGERRRCLDAVGHLVGRLHAAGFVHRDLHLRNLLRADDGALVVIDCSRGGFVPGFRLPRASQRDLRDLGRDLARFVPDERDRWRVLRAYLGTLNPGRGWRKAVSRAVRPCPARRSRDRR